MLKRSLLPIAALIVQTSGAAALDCPAQSAIVDPTAAAAVQRVLPADVDLEAPEALQSAVYELRQAGVADRTILNNLIVVYCVSVAADAALSETEKTQKVEAFSRDANGAVFGGAQ